MIYVLFKADFMRGFSVFTFSAHFLAKMNALQMSQMIDLFKAYDIS